MASQLEIRKLTEYVQLKLASGVIEGSQLLSKKHDPRQPMWEVM